MVKNAPNYPIGLVRYLLARTAALIYCWIIDWQLANLTK